MNVAIDFNNILSSLKNLDLGSVAQKATQTAVTEAAKAAGTQFTDASGKIAQSAVTASQAVSDVAKKIQSIELEKEIQRAQDLATVYVATNIGLQGIAALAALGNGQASEPATAPGAPM